jgi:hypothetical protein
LIRRTREREGKELTMARVTKRSPVRYGQGTNAYDIPAIFGDNRGVDGIQRDEGSSVAWLALSIASRGEGEVWPEELGQRWLRSSTKASICCGFKQTKDVRRCARVW